MAGKQVTGDGLSFNFTGISKNQLYDIMSQMKNLIEKNQDQAEKILIQNSLLTKALFQAQIMLGMVHPPIPSSGLPLQKPLQTPVPSQLRPPSVQQPYHNQYPPQIGPAGGFSHSGGPTQRGSQPMYHSAPRPASSMGVFPQGQPLLPTQQLPQSMCQVGGASHSGSALFSHHPGDSVQGDIGSSWVPGLSEPNQFLSSSPLAPPSQEGRICQPAQSPSLSPEMEKALLQQVMSLTQEQLNLLPPEQRSQVLHLRQMLR